MKYFLQFPLELLKEGRRASDVAYTRDTAFFESLWANHSTWRSKNPCWLTVATYHDNEVLEGIIQKIHFETGRVPVADSHFAISHKSTHFSVRIERRPEKPEIQSAPWLYLLCPTSRLAIRERVESDETYVVRSVSSKNKIGFGYADHVPFMMMFTERLRDQFLETDLKPLEFRSVKLTNGKPSGLWQLWSHVFMPPLDMSLRNSLDQPFDGDLEKGCGFYDGSYWPKVLRYDRRDILKVPHCDVALTAERRGAGSSNSYRDIIVSQRFREVAEKLAPGQFKFGVVAVGEGDELRNRYTLPEFAPPDEVTA